ncbi:MAG: 50S ribosomal protein L18e, partial [Candidatus Diapherotrites archaeon]|nr:50S ribosomal protein L18e [Candidatus Diapherotrites archaeon]
MKRTGPTKESTRKLAVGLEKQSKKSKKNIFRRIADEITKPTRHRVEVNLWKLNLMSKQFQGKTLVVPGKILSYGKLENPITVAA